MRPGRTADEKSAARACSDAVGFFSPEAGCDGVAVTSGLNVVLDAGAPAAKSIAAGRPPGSGERKNAPPVAAPLAAGPLTPEVSEKAKTVVGEAGTAADAS